GRTGRSGGPSWTDRGGGATACNFGAGRRLPRTVQAITLRLPLALSSRPGGRTELVLVKRRPESRLPFALSFRPRRWGWRFPPPFGWLVVKRRLSHKRLQRHHHQGRHQQ